MNAIFNHLVSIALHSATNLAKQRIPLPFLAQAIGVENPHAIVGSILSWQGKDNAVSTDTKVAITQLNSLPGVITGFDDERLSIRMSFRGRDTLQTQ